MFIGKDAKRSCFTFLVDSFTLHRLTLFDIGFFEPSVEGPHHNFVVVVPMIMTFGTGTKLDVFYTMVTKNCDATTITPL